MCGVVGIFEFSSATALQMPVAYAMARRLRHRGPDGEGFASFEADGRPSCHWGPDTRADVRDSLPDNASDIREGTVQTRAILAHRRLSILDVSSAGHQPMASQNGRYWICYNGEIYNYIELRADLEEMGETFLTGSDTEVALRAYMVWGSDCCSRFNGDWAMMIYDTVSQVLFVTRDRFGIKPLYYYQDGERIVFASEIKSFFEHPDIDIAADRDVLEAYLARGANEWSDETPFQGIRRFPCAHFARIDLLKATPLQPQRYFALDVNRSRETFDPVKARQYADLYYTLLEDAVRIRLRSDVPLGCSLSGGLDSSAVVYLAHKIFKQEGVGKELQTFSLVHNKPEDAALDESRYVDILQTQLDFSSSREEPRIEDVPQIIQDVIRYWENPPDGIGLAGFATVRIAKNLGLTVILDGQGADEVQAGYHPNLISYLGRLSLPNFVSEAAAISKNLVAEKGYARNVIVLSLVLNLFGKNVFNGVCSLFGTNFHIRSPTLNDELRLSVDEGLANLIHYSDSRSMYFSIESRMPFMDHRLIEFSLGIPDCYKVHNGFTKYFARLAFDGKLPNEITWRKDKMGWPVPTARLLDGELADWVDDLISNSEFVNSFKLGDKVKTTTIRGRALNLAIWHETFFKS